MSYSVNCIEVNFCVFFFSGCSCTPHVYLKQDIFDTCILEFIIGGKTDFFYTIKNMSLVIWGGGVYSLKSLFKKYKWMETYYVTL
jgi:hypothetical protein